MNPHLAAMYNTHGAGEVLQEEQTKIASLELFAKTAAAEGIDLSTLSPEDQNALYSQFVEKLAMEHEGEGEKKEPPKKDEDDDEEDKEAAARAELAQTQDWQQKVAEADFLGRTMAHAFWNESGEIEKDAGVKETAQGVVNKAKFLSGGFGEKGKRTQAARNAMKYTAHKGKEALKSRVAKDTDWVSKNKGKALAATGAGVGLAGAAAYGAKKAVEKKKEGSAFDEVAAEQAVKIAAEAGWDTDEAVNRLNAVITLGGLDQEETKVAHVANDYDAAVNVRGLEFLEAAGYPVDWEQVFSG